MAAHSNLKSKKCWSCIYFGGKRKINRFLSITIDSDDKGTCMCPKCPHSGKTVLCDNSCPKWQIDKVTFDAQREVEQKKIEKENKKIEQKQREEERLKEQENFNRKKEYSSYSPDSSIEHEDAETYYNYDHIIHLSEKDIIRKKEQEDRARQEFAEKEYSHMWRKSIPDMHAAFRYAKEYPDEKISKKNKKI